MKCESEAGDRAELFSQMLVGINIQYHISETLFEMHTGGAHFWDGIGHGQGTAPAMPLSLLVTFVVCT